MMVNWRWPEKVGENDLAPWWVIGWRIGLLPVYGVAVVSAAVVSLVVLVAGRVRVRAGCFRHGHVWSVSWTRMTAECRRCGLVRVIGEPRWPRGLDDE